MKLIKVIDYTRPWTYEGKNYDCTVHYYLIADVNGKEIKIPVRPLYAKNDRDWATLDILADIVMIGSKPSKKE